MQQESPALFNKFLLLGERHAPVGDFEKRRLVFCSLRVTQPVNLILPFNTFKTHSLTQLTSSLLHLEMIALRKFGSAVFSTCRV